MRPCAADLHALYTVCDDAGVDEVLSAHPSLLPLLVLVHEEIRDGFDAGHATLLDAVRAIPSGDAVGLIVLVSPAHQDPRALVRYERVLTWFRAGPSRAARGRLALGLLPSVPPAQAANDNAAGADSSAVD